MLLCMLAAVVIAGAVLGLAQSHRHSSEQIRSRRAVVEATQMAQSLHQRAIAVVRNNPSFSGQITPPLKSPLGSYATVKPISKTEVLISVFSYGNAATPCLQTTFDPASSEKAKKNPKMAPAT